MAGNTESESSCSSSGSFWRAFNCGGRASALSRYVQHGKRVVLFYDPPRCSLLRGAVDRREQELRERHLKVTFRITPAGGSISVIDLISFNAWSTTEATRARTGAET